MKKYWFVFCKTDIMLKKESEHYTIPLSEETPVTLHPWTHVLNVTPMEDGTEVKAVMIDQPITDNPLYEMCGLRPSFYHLSKELYLKAGKCHELLYWDNNTKFCGVCGAPMKMHTDISKRCTNCGKEVWPQLATAVIVLVHRDNEILLVHARNFKTDFYGLVAGFVETGETLEEAVHREVEEETGIKIKNIRYFGSQPWPYPCGLMVGFNADYDRWGHSSTTKRTIKGAWFTKDNLPTIPEPLSIARMILDDWINKTSI